MRLDRIDRAKLEELARLKAKEGVADATINRYLAAIAAVLSHARKKGWLATLPAVPRRREGALRLRWATQQQAAKLIAHLPPHLAAMAEFALATGLRRFNVTHLQWSAVDLRRRVAWVHADESKSGRTLTVPLSEAALTVLRRQRGQHVKWVFPYRGRVMVRQGADPWRAACKKAGLKGFRWHDLRHTWASWHVQNGTELAVLKELGGWRSLAMVMRYAHLAPSHVAAYAGNSGLVQNRAQSSKRVAAKRAA